MLGLITVGLWQGGTPQARQKVMVGGGREQSACLTIAMEQRPTLVNYTLPPRFLSPLKSSSLGIPMTHLPSKGPASHHCYLETKPSL